MAPPEPVPVGWDKFQQPEVGVLKVDQREQIRRAYFIEGKSIRQIALEGHHHRRTVRHALRDTSLPRYTHRQPRARPVLGPFVHLIDQWLAEDLTRPAKQRHTAHRIYQRLVEEHGFTGKEANLRQYVREQRPTPRHSRLFIPLTYQPGEDAQCDFGEAQVVLAGRQVKVQLFCIRLCYSKISFVMALPHQQQEAFFEGHQQAFSFFGGVPQHIWYDNLSQAVRPRLLGHRPQEQESFVAFRSHYLFESRFCTPAQAHEKGLVEGLVGYARRNFLVPVPEVNSLQELNDLLQGRCRAEAHRRLRGEGQTIGELWDQERPHLLPLPRQPYPCCRTVPVRPNRLSLVTFQTNRYSVPVEWANHSLFLRAFVDRVEISNGSRVLAVHPRCYQREQDVLHPFHYLPLLRERPGALDHAKPLQPWPHPAILDQYLAALRDRLPQRVATLEFVRVLELCSRYPLNQVAQGVEQALLSKSLSSDTVAYFLNTGHAMTSRPVPIPLAGPAVQERDLRQYDLLLGLPAMVRQYQKLAQEATQQNRSYQDYLLSLLELEVAQREENQQKRRIAQAHFPYLRTLDQFEFSAIPSVNHTRVLELAKGEYLSRQENIILVGNMGTGKTHCAIALGLLACRQGKRVRFYTATGLVNELLEAQEERILGKRLAQLQKLNLLVLDEVGFVPFTPEGGRLLFQVFADRYLRGSVLITTNLEFGRWVEVFGDERMTGALLDRLTHQCHILEFNGDSYRFKESLRLQGVNS